MNAVETSLYHFKECADGAPEGTYGAAKEINEVIGDLCDELRTGLVGLGLKCNNNDPMFTLEAAIYEFIKKSNPDESLFASAEGCGRHLLGPHRARVVAQLESERDFLRTRCSAAANQSSPLTSELS